MSDEFKIQGEVFKTDSGTSTSKCPDYSQLHIRSMARIAAVYEEGEVVHGRDNWKNGVGDEKFKRDRLNHAIQHLKLYDEGDRSVDHLAKVGWFCDMRMELERLEAEKPTEFLKRGEFPPYGDDDFVPFDIAVDQQKTDEKPPDWFTDINNDLKQLEQGTDKPPEPLPQPTLKEKIRNLLPSLKGL